MTKRSTVISHGKVETGELIRDNPPDFVTAMTGLLFFGPAFGPGVAKAIMDSASEHTQTIRTDDGRMITGRKK